MEENVLFLFRSCCHGNCVPLDVRAQCLFVSTLWPAAAPSTDLLMGKELKILRSHSLAEVGIEPGGQAVLSGRLCGHKSHRLTCRHKLSISASSQTCKNSNTCYKASFSQSPMQARLYMYAQLLPHAVMEGLRLEKTSSIIKSVPQPFVFFFPPLVLASSFSSESVFLKDQLMLWLRSGTRVCVESCLFW